MTTYGIDVSVYQAGIDWGAVSAAGMEYSFARATIGLRVDGTFASHKAGAQGQGLIAGAYHFLEPGSGKDQADVFLAATNQCQGILAALDCEAPGLTTGLIDDFRARFRERTNNHPLFIYTGISFWVNHGNSPIDLLWLAYYPKGGYPGDSSPVWDRRIGGVKPTIWQYGPRPIKGRAPVDGDAYRGTKDELQAYTASAQSGPVEGTMLKISSPTPALIDLPVGAQLYDLAFQPLVKVSVQKLGQVSPYEVERNPASHCRVAHIAIAGVDQMVLINDGDANVRPVPPSGDIVHDVTIAVDGNPQWTVKV